MFVRNITPPPEAQAFRFLPWRAPNLVPDIQEPGARNRVEKVYTWSVPDFQEPVIASSPIGEYLRQVAKSLRQVAKHHREVAKLACRVSQKIKKRTVPLPCVRGARASVRLFSSATIFICCPPKGYLLFLGHSKNQRNTKQHHTWPLKKNNTEQHTRWCS